MVLEPNSEQKEVINYKEGILKVNAGAGTGKTFTVSKRYSKLLENEGLIPKNILLLTFTNNAAEEMKKRVVGDCNYTLKDLVDAPISTFHSFAKKIVLEKGFTVPKYLGIEERISPSTRVFGGGSLEVAEIRRFRNFFEEFKEAKPEYKEFYTFLESGETVLNLIKNLASKGVVPTDDGWYRNCEKYLKGDFEEFKELLSEINQPEQGKRSLKQSKYLKKVKSRMRDNCFLTEDFDKDEVLSGKKVDDETVYSAFMEDRTELFKFLHDIYLGYIRYSLANNYMNFSFLMLYAFILLVEDEKVREDSSFEYTMVDEFQDTSEIQFKVLLLLSKGNILVVGDWKQSIYSFQYASVKNITDFEKRIKTYKEDLNGEKERIGYPVDDIDEIGLKKNYRSSQALIDFSKESLFLKATNKDEVDEKYVEDNFIHLKTYNKDLNTSISCITSEKEEEGILRKVQEIVGNEDYELESGETPKYKDIAILSRTRSFGLSLQRRADDLGIPLSFEGGVELFSTRPGILALAWLRILEYKGSKKGWAVVLEEAGYSFCEIREILSSKEYPEDMLEFLKTLKGFGSLVSVVKKVFNKYGISDCYSSKIVEVLSETLSTEKMSNGQLVSFIEECIEKGLTYRVDGYEEGAVTMQTIHSSKGLEYPIVIIADVNERKFPNINRNRGKIVYDETVGVRSKKVFEKGYLFDNLETSLVLSGLSSDYSEERRLMYVGITRAEQHLVFSAEKGRESRFFKGLERLGGKEFGDGVYIIVEEVEELPEPVEKEVKEFEKLENPSVTRKAPVKKSVHSLVEFKQVEEGRGIEIGKEVHKFAEQAVNEISKAGEITSDPTNRDEKEVKDFLEDLSGEVMSEVPLTVPVYEDGRKTLYNGVIDLLVVGEEKVKIIDWKTDISRENHEEYVKQVNMYKKGVSEIYSDKEVVAYIFYTYDGEKVEV